MNFMIEKNFDMTTPAIAIIPLWPDEDQTWENVLRLYRECGVRRFSVMLPAHPDRLDFKDKLEIFSARYIALREKAKTEKLGLGILLQSLINHADRNQPRSPVTFQRLVGLDSSECQNCYCPLDPGFQQYTREVIQTLARLEPDLLLVDDDFRMLDHYPVKVACACELHLELFASIAGQPLNAAAVTLALETGSDVSLRQAWEKTQLAGLEQMAQVIRNAADSVDPDLHLGICVCCFEEHYTASLARILAGKHRPFVRVNNAYYLEGAPRELPARLLKGRRTARFLDPGTEILGESDTCPHHRHSMSATTLRAHIAGSLLNGAHGVKLWVTDLQNGDSNKGIAYNKMLHKETAFFNAIQNLKVDWRGFDIAGKPISPLSDVYISKDENNPFADDGADFRDKGWGPAMVEIGMPFTYDSNSAVKALSGAAPLSFSSEELTALLSGPVLLDGVATGYLCRMGLGHLLGVKVVGNVGNLWRECYLEDQPINGKSAGKKVQRGTPADRPVKLKITDDSTMILSKYMIDPWFSSLPEVYVAPAVTAFTNSLGGRIVIYATAVANRNFSEPIRQAQLQGIVSWLTQNGETFPVVDSDAPCYLMAGREDDKWILALFNLSMDMLEGVPLRWPTSDAIETVQQLDSNGHWQRVDFTQSSGDQLLLETSALTLEPVVLRLTLKV